MKNKEKIIIALPGQILDYVDTKENLVKLYNYIKGLEKTIDKATKYVKENKTKYCLGRDEFTCEFKYSAELVKAKEMEDILKGE